MYKFKQLEWQAQEEQDGIYAEPFGLVWKYSISVIKNGQIRFAILDADYDYAPGFPEYCVSIADAQQKAATHYVSQLTQFVAA